MYSACLGTHAQRVPRKMFKTILRNQWRIMWRSRNTRVDMEIVLKSILALSYFITGKCRNCTMTIIRGEKNKYICIIRQRAVDDAWEWINSIKIFFIGFCYRYGFESHDETMNRRVRFRSELRWDYYTPSKNSKRLSKRNRDSTIFEICWI